MRVLSLLILISVNLNIFAASVKPKISIITSVYNSDEFITGFLENITQQTIFDQCELILINANSPGKIEEAIILKYQQRYANIIYQRLAQDPGIYAVWNLGIKQARGDYITNANVDDRLASNCYAQHAQLLDQHPEIALVYSDYYVSVQPNETFETVSHNWRSNKSEFSPLVMQRWCLPSFNPMWRRSVHARCGYFDETFMIAGDYEMWIRMVNAGLVFKKCPDILGVYYLNPDGLSTPGGKHVDQLAAERALIYAKYAEFFARKV